MTTSKTTITKRLFAANQALASVRAEGLEPFAATQKRLNRYTEGKLTLEQLQKQTLAEVKASVSK